MPFPPQVEQWRSSLQRFGGGTPPTDVALAWLAEESGGNVCSTGIPGREAGLAQTDHPGDDKYGLTFDQLRAPCSGSSLARQLTSDEIAAFAQQAISAMRGKAADAQRHLAAVGANWSGSDFWTAAKQEHALPCVMADLLPRVTVGLGRAPKSWAEFKGIVLSMAPGDTGSCSGFAASPSEHGLSSRLEDTMANAEQVGAYGGGFFSGTTGLIVKVAAAGAAVWVLYELAISLGLGGGSTAVAVTTNPARRRARSGSRSRSRSRTRRRLA